MFSFACAALVDLRNISHIAGVSAGGRWWRSSGIDGLQGGARAV